MEIHKPKPIHGWRELAKEVGIIVLGVLIALGAEQTVEAIHWRHRVADAAEAMRLELREDDGPQAYTRVAAEVCFDRQLGAIQQAIEAGESRQDVATLVGAYEPPIRSWDSEAWKATVASGVGAHVSPDQMINWSKPYRSMPELQEVNTQERLDQVALRPARVSGAGLSLAEADTMLAAVQRLRDENLYMRSLSLTLLFGMEKFGIRLAPDEQRRVLAGLRARYGDCVVIPSTIGVDPNDQLSGVARE